MTTNVYHGNFEFNSYKFNFMATPGNGGSICWQRGGKNLCYISVKKTWFGEECNITPLNKQQIKYMKSFVAKCEKQYK